MFGTPRGTRWRAGAALVVASLICGGAGPAWSAPGQVAQPGSEGSAGAETGASAVVWRGAKQVTDSADLPGSGNWGNYPVLAAGSDARRATATWIRRGAVQASASNNGRKWTAPARVSANGFRAIYPAVAVSADGLRVTAAWEQWPKGNPEWSSRRVAAAVSTDGGRTWAALTVLSDGGGKRPQIATSVDGERIVAVWTQFSGDDWRVMASSSADGGDTWTKPAELGQSADDPPQLVMSDDGARAVAVWKGPSGVGLLSAATADGGSSWQLSQVFGGLVGLFDVAASADAATVFLAANTDVVGSADVLSTGVTLWSSTDGGATWGDWQDISDGGFVPALGVSASGRAIVLASAAGDPSCEVQRDKACVLTVSTSTDGGISWSAARAISRDDGNDDFPYSVEVSYDGSTSTVLWREEVPQGEDFRVVGYDSATSTDGGQTWGPPSIFPRTAREIAGSPPGKPLIATSAVRDIAVSGDGTRVIALSTLQTTMRKQAVSASVGRVLPARAYVSVNPRKQRAALRVKIRPELGGTWQWRFRVLKKKAGSWKKLKRRYTTTGPHHTRTLNLDRGRYRVKARPGHGYAGATSRTIRLRR